MDNRVALITGAKGGLGNDVTKAFLSAGAKVAGASRSIQNADFPHPNFAAFQAELSSSEAAGKLADAVVAHFGHIDFLVHLVGGFAGGKTVADTDDAILERMLDLNLRSAFRIARVVVPHLRRAGSGRIVAIGSRAAVEPAATLAAYSASKAALVSLVGTLALENRDAGVTVNAVLPGMMDTPANRAADPKADFSRWVQPSRVAELVVWLCSAAAADVNGAAIPVYGTSL